MLLLQLPKHEAPLKWPMYLSPNFDTCLVCSLTAPDVVSGNCDIYRSVFISEVSAVMWQSGNKSHTLMSTTSRPVPKKKRYQTATFDFVKKRKLVIVARETFICFHIWTHSWTENNQARVKYSLNEESPWCVDVSTIHSSLGSV